MFIVICCDEVLSKSSAQLAALRSALAEQIRAQGPDVLKGVQEKALTMANDPEVQKKAKEYAAAAGDMAKKYGAMGANLFMQQVEQGPTGVCLLALL